MPCQMNGFCKEAHARLVVSCVKNNSRAEATRSDSGLSAFGRHWSNKLRIGEPPPWGVPDLHQSTFKVTI